MLGVKWLVVVGDEVGNRRRCLSGLGSGRVDV